MPHTSRETTLEYFKNKNSRFKNSRGMELGLIVGDDLWTAFYLSNHNDGPLAISIHTEGDSLMEFIEQFKLKAVGEIDNLDFTSSWMRYLNGGAEINVTPVELKATLGFKIVKRKTIITSPDLHFYDGYMST